MSNPIRYDSLLVRALARELDARFAGAPCGGIRLEPEQRRAILELGAESLHLRLHPGDGRILAGTASATPPPLRFGSRCTIQRIHAPADERVLEIVLRGARGTARAVVVELLTNQWNVLVLDARERIVDVLWPRDAGGRRLQREQPYHPPPPSARAGAEAPLDLAAWERLLASVPPRERERALVAGLAYTSPLNARAILGDAAERDDAAALAATHARYAELVRGESRPGRVHFPFGAQPYPVALPGLAHEPATDLLAAFAADADMPPALLLDPRLAQRARERIDRLRRRCQRLHAEAADAAAEATKLRATADLLLARASTLPKGAAEIELEDFDGTMRTVTLDPALSATANARRHYDAARKRQRAAERVPALVRRHEAEATSLEALLARALEGGEVAPLATALGPEREIVRGKAAAPLPYRRYRTSGGLEVRVGRSSRANDELTFHHSSPADVWLHARDNAGAHVILRWPDAEMNPPARDLAEAAVLAALHSRARTSGTVAVDWTRRKHVRKPRKAPPGAVVPERVRTLFVQPDAALEEALRVED